MSNLNSSIGKQYKKIVKTREIFSWKKFATGFFNLFSPIDWTKDLVSLFNLRKLIIYAIIIGGIFAYGYWKGMQGKPVQMDIGWEEETVIDVPKSSLKLYKPKNSNSLYWLDTKSGKKYPVTVADIPSLEKKLKPYGIDIHPIGVVGAGVSIDGVDFEAGGGLSLFRYYMMRLETFATNKGIYVGTSYKLENLHLENTSVGISYGRGWSEGEQRALLYVSWRF